MTQDIAGQGREGEEEEEEEEEEVVKGERRGKTEGGGGWQEVTGYEHAVQCEAEK